MEKSIEKNRMYFWYVWPVKDENDEVYLQLVGSVTGHKDFEEFESILSPPVKDIKLNWKEEEVIAKIEEDVFYCPFKFLNFDAQDLAPKIIPSYRQIRKLY